MDEKICPMWVIALSVTSGRPETYDEQQLLKELSLCKEAKCAWWNDDLLGCGVKIAI
jgi:hypothetical protein